jgi:phosphate transport system substrate-binding protein
MKTSFTALLMSAALFNTSTILAQTTVDEDLPGYEKTSGVSGKLSSVGSDTQANLMT